MRIISYNILKGGNDRIGEIIQVLKAHQPDVIILQEAYSARNVRRIANGLKYDYPIAGDNNSVAAICKQEPDNVTWHKYDEERSPFLRLIVNGWCIFGVHLSALHLKAIEKRRHRQVQALLQLIDKDHPNLLIGDFNAIQLNDKVDLHKFPFHLRVMVKADGGFHRLALPLVREAGFVDVFRELHPDDNGYTLPAFAPNTRLDYAFVPIDMLPYVQSCSVLQSPPIITEASDHLPLQLDLLDNHKEQGV